MPRHAAIEEVMAVGAACRRDERRGRGSMEEKDKEAGRRSGRGMEKQGGEEQEDEEERERSKMSGWRVEEELE